MEHLTAAAVVLVLLGADRAGAATRYVSVSGNDANVGTLGLPFRSLAHSVSRLSPGDQLVLLPGTWVGEQLTGLPNATKVRALNPGAAVIDANFNGALPYPNAAIDVAASDVEIDGLTARNGGAAVINVSGARVTLRNVSASTCDDSMTYCGVLEATGDDFVLEDSWVFGPARELISVGGARSVLRRVATRYDRYLNGGSSTQAVAVHGVDVLLENVVLFDCAAPSDPAQAYAAIFGNGGADRMQVRGSLVLNCPGFQTIFYLAELPNGNARILDSIVWGVTGYSLHLGDNGYAGHVTVGSAAFVGYSPTSAVIEESIITDAGSSSLAVSSVSNVYWAAPVPVGDVGSMIADPQLRYVVRAEAGSVAATGSPDGGVLGATMVSRWVDGGLTAQPLWPWPNEGRMRGDFCASAGRGWCATSKTFTQYIWEYLGTPAPGDVLDAGSPNDAGVPSDAGAPSDAGSPGDAGAPGDAGVDDDAGTTTVTRRLVVGCGCGTLSRLDAGLLFVACAALARRRRSRPPFENGHAPSGV